MLKNHREVVSIGNEWLTIMVITGTRTKEPSFRRDVGVASIVHVVCWEEYFSEESDFCFRGGRENWVC